MMDVDEVFNEIGAFGFAQKKIYYLMNAIHIFMGFHVLCLSFIGADPGWTCAEYPNIHNQSFMCAQYELGKCKPQFNTSFTSILTEWELICSRSYLPNLSQSAFFVGSLLGAWIWGTVADKIGRRKTVWLAVFLSIIFSLGYGLSPGYKTFVLFRLLCALSFAGVVLSTYVLSVELAGISARSYVGIASSAIFAISYPFTSFMVYYIRSWRTVTIVNTLMGLAFFLLWRVIPESPRWLLVNGHEQEARAVLSSIAEGNGTTMPNAELRKPITSQASEPVSMKDLFKGKRIRQRTIILVIVWFTNCMVYYALAMSAGNLGGNMYVSFALSGLVELPSYVIAYTLLDRIGRRWTHGGLLLMSGVSCLAWTLFTWMGHSNALKTIVALIGKFAVGGSFAVIYLYTAELFPTQVRNIGAGVASIGARLGGILSPIVLLLGQYNTGLPMLVMGGLAAAAGVLSLSLPETLNQSMPETLQELEM